MSQLFTKIAVAATMLCAGVVAVAGSTPAGASGSCASGFTTITGLAGTICQEVIETSGSYSITVPAGISEVDAVIVGAGGGGGGGGQSFSGASGIRPSVSGHTSSNFADVYGGGGGGGGAVEQDRFTSLTGATTFSGTVGAGGAGGILSGDNATNGSAGSATTLTSSSAPSSTITVAAGSGGHSGTNGGAGGASGGANAGGTASGTAIDLGYDNSGDISCLGPSYADAFNGLEVYAVDAGGGGGAGSAGYADTYSSPSGPVGGSGGDSYSWPANGTLWDVSELAHDVGALDLTSWNAGYFADFEVAPGGASGSAYPDTISSPSTPTSGTGYGFVQAGQGAAGALADYSGGSLSCVAYNQSFQTMFAAYSTNPMYYGAYPLNVPGAGGSGGNAAITTNYGDGTAGNDGAVMLRYLLPGTPVTVTASSPSAISIGQTIPSVSYTTDITPDWTGEAIPTCAVYAESDTTFSTPLTGTATTAGTYVTHCYGGGDGNYSVGSYVDGTLIINSTIDVTVTAGSIDSLTYGTPIPDIGYSTNVETDWTGEANPICAVYATGDSSYSHALSGVQNVGTYVTHCYGGGDSAYTPTSYVNGTLTISPATLAPVTNLTVAPSGTLLVGTFTPSPNANEYRCTLYYGYNNPSVFTYISTTPSCSFAGVDLTAGYGISVVAMNNSGNYSPSAPTLAFAANSLPVPSNGGAGSGGTPKTPHVKVSVYFATNSWVLSAPSKKNLTFFAARVVSRGLSKVSVIGFADPRGATSANATLSRSRANAVAKFLRTYFAARHLSISVSATGGGVNAGSSNLALDRVATASA